MIDINTVIEKLKSRRSIFVSEADFQLELAWTIKELYPAAKVRMEYCPPFDANMHIDILVVLDEKWIPIELKYKTKGCKKTIDNEIYCLKNHGAKDVNCYLYLKDIERIERVRNNVDVFEEGYAILLTNELSYLKRPTRDNVYYYNFSLEEGTKKSGILDWHPNTSAGTKKNCEDPIHLNDEYHIEWKEYSVIDDTNTGMFKVLLNKIEKR